MSRLLESWASRARPTRGTVEVETDPNGSVLHITNTSGINGVEWAARRKKWCARGYQAGRAVHIGYFDTIEDATAARAKFDSEPAKPSAPVTDAVAPNTAHEPVSAPVRAPIAEAISKLEAIKNPSRKVRRELGRLHEKQERRAERQAAAPAERTQFPSIQQTAKAFVAVLMSGKFAA
jgi:hypothetical protein